MNELEELMIYKQYLELMYYTNMIIKKFPKSERFILCKDIKERTNDGLELILYTYKSFDRNQKLKYLNELDVKLKFLKVLIRVAFKNRYISKKNYEVWCRKVTNITNLMGGWIRQCRKQ